MRITFLGLGLIGGSIARALRRGDPDGTAWAITAWSPDGTGPGEALAAGVIDRAASTAEAALDRADLVVLAAPPLACAALLDLVGGPWRSELEPGATVTDVASTKVELRRRAVAAGVPYVGGHPMAGLERRGFSAGDPDLFRGRPWVITDAVGGGDPARVEALARACGASPVTLDAERHDRLVAAISHLPLLTSVALVEAVALRAPDGESAPQAVTDAQPAEDWPDAAALTAGGWRDTTRLARGDVTMGAEILATNAAAITERLRAYRARIDEWIAILDAPGGPDATLVRERLAVARSRLGGPR